MAIIKLTLPGDKIIEVEAGVLAFDIVNKYAEEPNKVMLIECNQKICELNFVINKDSVVNFIDIKTQLGNKIYVKGLTYVFYLALKNILGYDVNYRVQTSVNHGLYVWFEEKIINNELIDKINNQMIEIINQDSKFEKVTVDRIEAIEYFKRINRPEKISLLKYNTKSYISLYKLADQYDYYYAKMPYSTKFVAKFELKYLNEQGLLLRFPTVFNKGEMPDFTEQDNLFRAYLNFSEWCHNQGIVYTSDLNNYVTFKDINELIRIEEGRHNNDLFEICKKIKKSETRVKTVLIAGPTSSGKTTTSKKLAIYLKGMGFNVQTLSVDDYFKERSETPRDEAGEYDYEGLSAIDVELFNQHLDQLFNGEEVSLPTYNFLTGIKEYHDKKIILEDNSVLIIEGLHALNDELTKNLTNDEKYKIYISPLVQLNLDKNNPISGSDVRMLRRMVRDRKFRGSSVAETIKVWPKVRAAEDKNIYKYQADANVVLNTSLLYEAGVLKTLAEAYLYQVSDQEPEYEQAKMLLNFLRNFVPIPTEEIPRDSLLREFIGGSCYE